MTEHVFNWYENDDLLTQKMRIELNEAKMFMSMENIVESNWNGKFVK